MRGPVGKGSPDDTAVNPADVEALRLMLQSALDRIARVLPDALGQVWRPFCRGVTKEVLLSTRETPFAGGADRTGGKMDEFRSIAGAFALHAGEGMPGRTYVNERPEWAQNVQLFDIGSFPRVNYAIAYQIMGSLCVPVWRISQQNTLPLVVIEWLWRTEVRTFTGYLEYISQVLRECGLTCKLNNSHLMGVERQCLCGSMPYALKETELSLINQALGKLADEMDLPLVQVWMRDGRSDSLLCKGLPFCLRDASFWHARQAFAEFILPLPEGRGGGDGKGAQISSRLMPGDPIVTKAFSFKSMEFVRDLRSPARGPNSMTLLARAHNLQTACATCVALKQSGLAFVVECFSPRDSPHGGQEHRYWHCKRILEILGTVFADGEFLHDVAIDECTTVHQRTPMNPRDYASKGSFEDPATRSSSSTSTSKLISGGSEPLSEISPGQSRATTSLYCGGSNGNRLAKISEESLTAVMHLSLRNAATALNVSMTTLKTACRRVGITRWPSRRERLARAGVAASGSTMLSLSQIPAVFKLEAVAGDPGGVAADPGGVAADPGAVAADPEVVD